MASRRLASSITLSEGTKRNSAFLSTNFLISHGQATRSTLTRSRVIHFTVYLLGRLLRFRGHSGRSAVEPDRRRLLARGANSHGEEIERRNEQPGARARDRRDARDALVRVALRVERVDHAGAAHHIDALALGIVEYVVGIPARVALGDTRTV